MSYYYNYYLGYQREDGKIYPIGPFDDNSKTISVCWNSRSFASDLHERFDMLPADKCSQQLKEAFAFEAYDGTSRFSDLKFLPVNKLPSTDYIRTGYFLVSDVERYLNGNSWEEDLFDESLSPIAYAGLIQQGPDTPVEIFGETYKASDFMFFAYPNRYRSEEWESFQIWQAVRMLCDHDYKLKEDQFVVLETEG